jgi:hypothetical protein
MSGVALNLFERRFTDLVKIGRAKLPSVAPKWTDHNAHDPGITLIELLAWVGEAQLYSLSKLRRDERRAYAALLGIEPAGTRAAIGLIWPDQSDPRSPAATFRKGAIVPVDAAIEVLDSGGPTFRPIHTLLWSPCTITSLISRHGDGSTSDQTRTNQRGTLPYLPFGDTAGRRDVLVASFACRDDAGLLGDDRRNIKGALWAIGVLADPPSGGASAVSAATRAPRRSPLTATLVTDDRRIRLPIASDTTQGMLTTGTILLDVSVLNESPTTFAIELSSPTGLPRPPRVLRVEPNVIPIRQGSIVRESPAPTGEPDWHFALEQSGLRFAEGEEPVTIVVAEKSGATEWRPGRLSEQGPDDTVYEFDARTGVVTFGNGVNGAIPPLGSTVLATYAVCDAERGETARNRKWRVHGFPGPFGVNPDPITGGAPSDGWIEQRRTARERSRVDHALISGEDLVNAAKDVPLLEVARAWVVPPVASSPRMGTVTIVAMRSRPGGIEPEFVPETARWLAAIRRQLVTRMPLGTRLSVTAPRYKGFSIHATVETIIGPNPVEIEKAINDTLSRRLALVEWPRGVVPRQPGVPVTARDVNAWIRSVRGVSRVIELRLRDARGKDVTEVRLGASGLPKWSRARSDIKARRPLGGNTP